MSYWGIRVLVALLSKRLLQLGLTPLYVHAKFGSLIVEPTLRLVLVVLHLGKILSWLPSLVVAIAVSVLLALDHAGYLHVLGDSSSVTSEHIRRAVLAKLGEVSVARTVIPLSDGWGASRLATAMLGMNGLITLRPAQSIDEPLLNHWDNESSCRHHSRTSAEVE